MLDTAAFRLPALFAALLLVLSAGWVAGPAHAEEGKWVTKSLYRTTTKCNPDTYRNKRQLVSWGRHPVVTHLHSYAIPPSGSHKVTKTTDFQAKVSAGATISGGVSAKVANKLIGEAEAHLNTTLRMAGSATYGRTTTVTDTVSNPTRTNKQFVFFKGVMKANGKWRKSFCSTYYVQPGDHFAGYRVYWSYGRWSSYNVPTDGAARCGAGTKSVNAVTKLALAQGC